MRRFLTIGLVVLVLAAVAAFPAAAATYNLTFGAAYATGSSLSSSTAEQYAGAGSWYELYPSGKTELYIDPVAQFGTSFTIDQIAGITYHTLNDATNPSDVDFYLLIYTLPFVGGDATWYGRRLNAEPLYSNGYVGPTAGVWNTWTTGAGSNQLTFFDSNHCGNFGFYNAPTLADLQAGPITWSAVSPSPGASATPIDYGSETVLYLNFSTGSGWPAFEGYLDAITVSLTNGDSYVIDLESLTDPVYVDDDWAGSAPGVEVEPGKFFGFNAFDTVQGGVDNVSGSTVYIAPGTYEEQVVIDGLDVVLQGSGKASTFIHSPPTLATTFMSPTYPMKPVITALNAADVQVLDLTVDGLGRGNANNRFVGVGFWNAGGKVLDCDITGIIDTPFSGVQHGLAIWAGNDDGGPYALEIGDCVVDEFQKNGITLSGTGLTVDVHGCTVTGKGDTSTIAQNGIQVSLGAGGTISGCTVSGYRYVPASVTSTGFLFYASSGIALSNTFVSASQTPLYWLDTEGSMTAVDAAGGDWDGATLYFTATSKAGYSASGAARTPAPADPLVEPGAQAAAVLGSAGATALQTITVDQSCFTGAGLPGTWGIGAYSSGGPVAVTVTNSTIGSYDTGVAAVGAAASLTVNDCDLSGNLTAAYDNTNSGNVQDATQNWWGDATGPSGDGGGSGGAVVSVGGEVDFDPWRIDGTSATACAFTPGTNQVDPVPESGCISTVDPCVNVDFVISRTDNIPMRGFSVTFALSAELELCTGLGDIVEGDYLSSVGGTNFQVLDLGGGVYTVDAAILGLPCGATAASDTLFSIKVKNSGGDGTGTVNVTSVIARDCVNQPIPMAGGSTSITIDNTVPAAVSGLTATQVKTGNDADGTTKITITYTAPGDAVAVDVYRKGFGFYPEYDDLGGAAPATPATPAAALGNGWVLASAVTASGDPDETNAERDFWYYVAFAYDACGNVSAVSNQTGGTLNYHLGDVVPLAAPPPFGNNLVDVFDISDLGNSYGTQDGDLLYDNVLDVGPTTDFFVDARPTTDNKIQFEDLMMFAINFGQVGKPGATPPAGADRNELIAEIADLPAAGAELAVTLRLASTGAIQGVSVPLTWDSSVVDYVGFAAGELMERQAGQAVVLSPGAGTVDAAAFGSTISGEGVLATVTFRVKASGDPAIKLGAVDARDAENRPVPLDGTVVTARDAGTTPVVTRLLPGSPNPFRAGTQIAFRLAEPGQVRVEVFALNGSRVRSLLDETLPAGERVLTWDGRNDAGRDVAAGTYIVRMVTPEQTMTQRMVRLR